MATGKASDFVVYQDQMRGGVIETLTQSSNFFNQGSNGAIRLSTISKRGDYAYESFITNISGLISRRDTTSVSAATALAVAMDEFISVKLNRKVGPVDQTIDSFRKVLMQADGPEALSFLIGTQIAKAMQVEMLNTGLRSARAALANQSAVTYTEPSSGTITSGTLNQGLAKFGDAYNRVVAWVMHSKVFFDLVGYQIDPTNNGDNIAGVVVQGASPATFGKPVIVTDSSALIVDEGTSSVPDNVYHTLGLTAGAVMVENTEEEYMTYDEVTGLENIVARLQGEFAYNVGIKGFKWDVANGAANPNDTALGTGSNWDVAASSYKDYAGIAIKTR
jgi:hypothetical protein